ncbi:MAG: PAS domain S-box protein, partial [Dongiaceae bacterium]
MTAYRLSQAALRESERQSRELIAALPGAMYTTDAAGRITFYNEAAVELWGHRPALGTSEWCGSWRLYWPDGSPMPHDECPMALALKEKRPIRGMEAVAERPDGSRVPFIPFPTPLFDASGTLAGAVNMLVDISDRKRAEELLRSREERLSSIFAQASVGFAEIDVTGRFTMVNDRYCAIMGRRRQELLQLRMQDITHPDDLARNLPLFKRAVEEGEPFEIEKRYLRPDGSSVWVNCSAFALKRPSGRVESVLAVCLDITERKQSQEQHDLLLREMSHRIKNLFAVTSGLVALSARFARTPDDMA